MLESYLLGLCLAAACPPVQGAPPIPPDPTLVGEYGSHKPKLAEGDLVGLDFMLLTDEEINRRFRIPEPGDTQSPWSHFLNPDHHGARDTLTVGSAPGDGSGAPSFGETAGLPFPYLLDLPATPPAAEFDSGWEHCGNWVAPKVYDRRRVVLPSGTGLYVFKPRTGHYVHPGAVGTDRVALILPMGYQGTNYSLNRGIEFEEPNPCVPEPFPSAPDCECSFGYQIVPNPTPVQVLMDENIIPDTPVYEALELGLTVVYVHFGTGRRNLYTHLAQMCEAASWLDSVDYQNPPGVPGTEPAVSHLKFTHGGSYMGGLAHTAAHFMPWIFAGAITMVGSEDIYGSFGSQIGTEAMTEQVMGQYRSGFVNVQRLSEDDLAFFSDGWRGYLPDAGDDYPGITGTPVDMAGLGMFTGALDFGLTTTQLPNLHVPIMIFRADVDQSQFTFYDDRHSAPPPTFLSELTSPPSGGQIIERRARRVEHDDGVAFREWNGEHRMLTDFVTNYLPTAAPARSAVTPKPTGEVEWRVRTMDSGGPLLDPEPREIMMEKPDTAWQASPSGIQAQVVSTPEWEALRYPTGIGAGDSLFWPGRDFIYGTTGLGEVVRMQVEYDGDRITEIALDERVSLGNHYGTAEMLSVSSTQAVALTQFGEVYDVDLANMTVAARSDRVGEILGRGLFRDGSDFGAVNEQGEVALFAKDVGASVDRWYLEGGAGPVSSTTSGYYYSSPDGNLKRTDLGHPDYNHPTVPDDISPHLYGHATHIIPIASGFLLYMPGGNRQLVQLSSSLDVVAKGDLVVEFSTGQGTKLFPDGLHVIESGGGSLPELLMWGLGNDEPRDQDFKRTSSRILRCTLGQTTGSDVDGVDTLAITAFSFVEVPGQVTSVIPSFDHESATIGWGGLADPPTNKARWLFALQDGRLGLIDDFGGTGSGVTRTYGKPIAASFGLMNLHEIPVVANTPGIQPWMHLVGHGDSQFVLEESHTAAPVLMNHGPVASLVNSFPVETEVDPPTRGAFLTVNPTPSNGGVGVRTVGFPDGGARYHVPGAAHEDVLAYPWTPPGESLLDVRVGRIRIVALVPDGTTGEPVFEERWVSDGIENPGAIGVENTAGYFLDYFGNACEFGDVDGDKLEDLIVGTAGGELLWFRNKDVPTELCDPEVGPCPPPPIVSKPSHAMDFDTAPTGSLDYIAALGLPASLGPDEATSQLKWTGDLGSMILDIQCLDLDGDPDNGLEILVGTGFDTNEAHPMDVKLSASLWVFKVDGDNLVPRGRLQFDETAGPGHAEIREHGLFGICPVSLTPAGTEQYVAVGTAKGRILVVKVEPNGTDFDLSLEYATEATAPVAGAYGSMRATSGFKPPVPPAGADDRVVFTSTGGIYAVDISKP